MADRTDFYFRQKVTEAELDLAFALLEKADRNIAADIGGYGIDMKRPPLFATGLRPWRQPPQAATGAVCPRVRPASRNRGPGRTCSGPLHAKKPPSRTTCPNIPQPCRKIETKTCWKRA